MLMNQQNGNKKILIQNRDNINNLHINKRESEIIKKHR